MVGNNNVNHHCLIRLEYLIFIDFFLFKNYVNYLFKKQSGLVPKEQNLIKLLDLSHAFYTYNNALFYLFVFLV